MLSSGERGLLLLPHAWRRRPCVTRGSDAPEPASSRCQQHCPSQGGLGRPPRAGCDAEGRGGLVPGLWFLGFPLQGGNNALLPLRGRVAARCIQAEDEKVLVLAHKWHYLSLFVHKNHPGFNQQKPPCNSSCSQHHRARKLPLPPLLSAFIAAVQKAGCSSTKSPCSASTDKFYDPKSSRNYLAGLFTGFLAY